MSPARLEYRWAKTAAFLWLGVLLFLSPLLQAQETQTQEPEVRIESRDGLKLERKSVVYRSPEGDFSIEFPEGCDRIRATAPTMTRRQDDTAEQDYLKAYCDRGGQPGQGAAITAYYAVTSEDGKLAGPAEVVERIGQTLAAKSVRVVHQTEVRKEFPGGTLAEGVDVLAQEPGGAGQVWVRGLLVDGIIYLLEAWNQAGGLWDDPDYQNFFNSFELIE